MDIENKINFLERLQNTKSICLLAIGIIYIVSMFQLEHWKKNIYYGDSWGYYSYLPAYFIHHDLGDYKVTVETTQKYESSFVDPLLDPYGLYHKHPTTGHNVIKYSSGVALMLSPFFAVSHFIAKIGGLTADGFSTIYKLFLGFGVIFWVSLGLWSLYSALEKYFSQFVTVLTIVSISLATNLFYNTTLNAIMSHGLLFSLYSILIYFTQKYFENPSNKKAILIGLVAGLISLTRMTELYCLLIPLLWGIDSISDRIRYFIQNFNHLLVALIAFIIPFIPQIVYWKYFTGDWIHNGYVGETFNFKNPIQIYRGLFSFDNGWLIWSPIMILSIVGLFYVRKKASDIFWPLIILLPLHIYIVYSWWCFNYINGFGSRPMEQMYPILSFAMASLFYYFSHSNISKIVMSVVISYFLVLNIFQNYQTSKGLLITNFSSAAYYYHMLWQTKSNLNILTSRASKQIQPSETKLLDTLYFENFEDTSSFTQFSNEIKKSGNYSRKLQGESIVLHSIPKASLVSGRYIKVTLNCFFTDNIPRFTAVWDLPYMYVQWMDQADQPMNKYESGIYPFQYCGNPNFSIYSHGVPNTWGQVSYYVRIPNGPFTKANLGIWNPKNAHFYIDDLTVELHE